MSQIQIVTHKGTVIQNPPIARWFFDDIRSAWIWLILRLWLASYWIPSGWGKLNNPAWMESGVALRGFWENAVAVPEGGRPPISFDWYRSFIQYLLDIEAWTWFAKVIAFSEFAIGLALLLGLLTGFAAFGGGFMNWNFIMAGSASSNGLLFLLSVLLVLAWKVAGWWGLDRWILPYLGTPWADLPSSKTGGDELRST